MSKTAWSDELEALLDEYVLGGLEGEDLERALNILEQDTTLGHRARAHLRLTREAVDALALDLPPLLPSQEARGRLLEDIAQTHRMEDHVAALVRLLDLGASRVRELLSWLDDAARWEPGPSPTSSLIHLSPGPAVVAANVGFVRVQAGADFPHHTHEGREVVLILQGGLLDSDGSVHRAGALIRAEDASEHSFQALPGADLIYLVSLERGVRFDFPFEI